MDNDGCYIFRLPGDKSFQAYKGNVENGLTPDSFIISPFDINLSPQISISSDEKLSLDTFPFSLLEESPIQLYPATFKKKHHRNVDFIISQLNEREKCVSCRYIPDDSRRINLKESFLNLHYAFPQCMVFCFYTPQSGTWIGASPELLLKKKENTLTTMALAGTRPSKDSPEEWDKKNIEEQEIVTDYIKSVLSSHGIPVKIENPLSTHKAGAVEHLRTDISGDSSELTCFEIKNLLDDLAPTPALCGFPKMKAFQLIKETEKFPREYYGGFFGPYYSDGNFNFYVLLRSLKAGKEGWAIYAGGGITSDSLPEEEYRETERKAENIISHLIFK